MSIREASGSEPDESAADKMAEADGLVLDVTDL